ncbi:hypothetical protein I4U23_004476 [Adineta vaga]|nr:hypothetical protein I4U23_004476 [Adineta vaga]
MAISIAAKVLWQQNVKLIGEFEESYQSSNALHWYLNHSFLQKIISKSLHNQIEQVENKRYVRLTLVNDGKMIIKKYIDDTRLQMENLSIRILFDKLMIDSQQWDQSLKYFQYLKNEVPLNEDLSWIEHSMGCKALNYFQRALNIQQKHYLSDHIEISYTLDYYQQALQMTKIVFPTNQLKTIGLLRNIANIFLRKENYNQTLDLHYEILRIIEQFYPADHIGQNFYFLKRYDEALEFYNRALIIRKNHYPNAYKLIITTFKDLGYIYYLQNKYDESIEHYSQVLIILKEFEPTNHDEIANYLEKVSECWFQNEFYDRSSEYIKQALEIRESSLLEGYSSIVKILVGLRTVQERQHQYDLALNYALQLYSILERTLSPNDVHIGKNLSYIGLCYAKLNQFKVALEYNQRALNVCEYLLTIIED